MLTPQANPHRRLIDLSGLWNFRADPDKIGASSGWPDGVPDAAPLAVPASWNDQRADLSGYLGDGWYQTRFARPWGWAGKRAWLRFGSVNYLAEVWLNGARLGEHAGGHLPFEFDITPHLREDNQLVVRVNGELRADRVPPGYWGDDPRDSFLAGDYPPANYDFFPYCGIHRPVTLYATAPTAIRDLTVVTDIDGSTGLVSVTAQIDGGDGLRLRAALSGFGAEITADGAAGETLTLPVPEAALWSPGAPNLYTLTVELLDGERVSDQYRLPVGIRTIVVDGDRLLLNGEPIYLTGFGRHEDFAVVGRGYLPALAVKDFDLMRWIGANSFRTSHYPYAEEVLTLADRLGVLVIAETPAVGLYFHPNGSEARAAAWEQQVRELIARDKNHPSVILWSLANEPHARRPEARPYFEHIFALARQLDPSRPHTFTSYLGLEDSAFDLGDVICLNRYTGWYTESGQIAAGVDRLSAELDAVHAKFPRPVMLTEFGADTVPGLHRHPPEMFSEEYQADFLEAYIALLREKPYVVGEHVWNMCDFKTGQAVRRVGGMNLKGVFTRDRQPKLAAHRLRALWTKPE